MLERATKRPAPVQQARSAETRRRLYLVGLLALLLAAYFALRPTLRRMSEETARIDRQTEATQTEARRLQSTRERLDQARAAVARNPQDGQAHLTLAIECSSAGDLPEAEREATAGLRLMPGHLGAQLLLADVYERDRRFDAAMDTYRRVLTTDPRNETALARLGYLYIAFGWTRDARALLEPAVRALPANLHLKEVLALAYLQNTDFAHAERLLQEVRAAAPDDVSQWMALADVYLKMRRPLEAAQVARDGLARDPANTRLLAALNKAYLDAADYQNATATAQQMIAAAPTAPLGHYRLALAYHKSGRDADAERELQTVQQESAGYEQTELLLGQLYLRENRAAAGQELLTAYHQRLSERQRRTRISFQVNSKPDQPASHWRMAQTYAQDGDRARAIVELKQTLELEPANADAQRMLAELLRARGDGQ